MYEVLIVDDEPLARQSLQYLIDWEACGFAIAAEAEDGRQALELMRRRHFSLVLTDIRMPVMNGLDFIAELRRFSDAPVVILTGYEDFQYARQGLKLGVQDYLLKPVDEDELVALLKRIGEEIAGKRLEGRRQRLGLSALRDQFLRKLALGQASRRELAENAELLELRQLRLDSLDSQACCVMLAEMDFMTDAGGAGDEDGGKAGFGNGNGNGLIGGADGKGDGVRVGRRLTERDIELKRFAVRNVLEEALGERGLVFEWSEERYGMLLTAFDGSAGGGAKPGTAGTAAVDGSVGRCVERKAGTAFDSRTDDRRERRTVMAVAAELADAVLANVKETISVGIGRPVSDARDAAVSSADAERALDGKFLRGNGCILAYPDANSEVEGAGSAGVLDVLPLQAALLDAIAGYSEERVAEALARLREGFLSGGLEPVRMRAAVLELFVRLLQLVNEMGGDAEALFRYEHGDYDKAMKARTAEELCALVERKCRGVLELLNRTKEMKPNTTVAAVKQIVAERFRENVSLRGVAREIYMNPNYLGKVFKSGTGLSFNDYVLQVRMEEAQRLLLRTDMKVYEIAERIGYGELDWFYKKFKAYTGISAGEYRSRSGG